MGIDEIIFILIIFILLCIPIVIIYVIIYVIDYNIEKFRKQKYSQINSSSIKVAVSYIEDGIKIIQKGGLESNCLTFWKNGDGFIVKIHLSRDDLYMIDIGGNIYENRGWSVSNDRKWLQRISNITYQGGWNLFETMVIDELKKKYSHLVYENNIIKV